MPLRKVAVRNSLSTTRPKPADTDASTGGSSSPRRDAKGCDGEPVGAGTRKVGGELPSHEDAAANSGVQKLVSLQGTDIDADGVTEWTQSIIAVDAGGGMVTGVDFGFTFNVIVNTNDAGQGSLRQFILNANLLN